MALVGTSQLAKALNITPRHIQRLCDQGVLQRLKRGQYDLGKCMAAFIRYQQKTGEKKEERTQNNADGEMQAVRQRLLTAQAEREELALKRERALVIPIAVYEQETADRIMSTKTRILQLPSIASCLEFLDRAAIKERLTTLSYEWLDAFEHGWNRRNGHDPGNGDSPASGEPSAGEIVAAPTVISAERVGAEKHSVDEGKKRKAGTIPPGKIPD
jgi:hypothetical protein